VNPIKRLIKGNPLASIDADPDEMIALAAETLDDARQHLDRHQYPAATAAATVATADIALATYLRTHANDRKKRRKRF